MGKTVINGMGGGGEQTELQSLKTCTILQRCFENTDIGVQGTLTLRSHILYNI